jgi:hypothetical protein
MDTTRRGCLRTALALSLARPASPAPEPAEPRDSSFDPWVEVHPENLRHNVREVSRRAGARPILAVIKNNGYGLGVANVGRSAAAGARSLDRHVHRGLGASDASRWRDRFRQVHLAAGSEACLAGEGAGTL